MDKEKINITLEKGMSSAQIVILEGQAPKQLDHKEPVRINIKGTISAPAIFLKQRINEINPNSCHVLADTGEGVITLVIDEDDPYTRGEITGKLEISKKIHEFGINTGKEWEPNQLGQFLKMNRSFFESREENMALVTELLNFEAKINQSIERKKSESGSFADNFSGTVTSNLPGKFRLKLPLITGEPKETIDVEFMADVKGRTVSLYLYSPDAVEIMTELTERVINEQLEQMAETLPRMPIIYQ